MNSCSQLNINFRSAHKITFFGRFQKYSELNFNENKYIFIYNFIHLWQLYNNIHVNQLDRISIIFKSFYQTFGQFVALICGLSLTTTKGESCDFLSLRSLARMCDKLATKLYTTAGIKKYPEVRKHLTKRKTEAVVI